MVRPPSSAQETAAVIPSGCQFCCQPRYSEAPEKLGLLRPALAKSPSSAAGPMLARSPPPASHLFAPNKIGCDPLYPMMHALIPLQRIQPPPPLPHPPPPQQQQPGDGGGRRPRGRAGRDKYRRAKSEVRGGRNGGRDDYDDRVNGNYKENLGRTFSSAAYGVYGGGIYAASYAEPKDVLAAKENSNSSRPPHEPRGRKRRNRQRVARPPSQPRPMPPPMPLPPGCNPAEMIYPHMPPPQPGWTRARSRTRFPIVTAADNGLLTVWPGKTGVWLPA